MSTDANSDQDSPSFDFSDATQRLGLNFKHSCGPVRDYFVPEIMSGGVALFDYDNDEDLDIYLINGAPSTVGVDTTAAPNRLFRRRDDGSYEDVTEASGLGDQGFGMGVACGDYDNDGFIDVYVTNYGPNALYRNNGDGTFANVTEQSGTGHADLFSASATFVDFDADGYLDLYVSNYVDYDTTRQCFDKVGRAEYCGPEKFGGVADTLYRNKQDGTFVDVSESAGIAKIHCRGLGVVAADLNDDGLVDLYVANDMDPNQLWTNNGDGTFSDEAVLAGAAFNVAGQTEASMGVICEDLDGDADLDLFMTHLRGESNTLYGQQAKGVFYDMTAQSGMLGPSVPNTGFGAAAGDFDQDGDLDVAIVNGHVFRGTPIEGAGAGEFWNDYAQRSTLLRNCANKFSDVSATSGVFGKAPFVGRGLAMGDIDNDGDLDLVVSNCNGPARLFLNETSTDGSWLGVRALTVENRDALGAKIEVVSGPKHWIRIVRAGFSYLSSSDTRAHFGLGNINSIDELNLTWPDGRREQFTVSGVNKHITVRYGDGHAKE